MIRPGLLSLAPLLLAVGCTAPGQKLDRGTYDLVDTDGAQRVDHDMFPITPQLLAALSDLPPSGPRANPELEEQLQSYRYRIGPQDVLTVTVWDHPELTIPAGEFRDAEIQGHLVGPEGNIYFPYVGDVRVAGRTATEVRDEITARLSEFIQDPQLDVRVAAFRSKRVTVTGEVTEPGMLPLTDVPLTLVEALTLAGGATPEAALQRVQVMRDGETRTFDVLALLERGDMRQNILLQDDDLVYVPEGSFDAVHMLGEVETPGVVRMVRGRMNLAEALALSGGFDSTEADAGRVFVFRGGYEEPQIFWLDAQSADAMLLATQFQMQPQDVVFVAPTGLSRWNRLVNLLLPSVQSLWQTQALIDELRDE